MLQTSREKRLKKLNNYIQKYYDSAKDCLLRYAREQQKLITPEANEWNLIREKLNNEVIGIKWTHKVPDPKPAPMPMLPEGLGRTGNQQCKQYNYPAVYQRLRDSCEILKYNKY